MQEMNLVSIRNGAKATWKKYDYEPKNDKLNFNFKTDVPNQVWVSDVTYYQYAGKYYYICAIIDLYARKVIACKLSIKHSTQLITSTFRIAYKSRQPKENLIFHSDRGSQYTSYAFQNLLKKFSISQSFSPSGSPQHNAVMESFFSSMKKEELYRRKYHSLEEFKTSIDKYVEFYNDQRPHATNKYQTPNAVEQAFAAKNK